MYYIERNIVEGNSWILVTIENDRQSAIDVMNKLSKEHPKIRYRVVEYVDSSHVSMVYGNIQI